jgi:hypothetical protein
MPRSVANAVINCSIKRDHFAWRGSGDMSTILPRS